MTGSVLRPATAERSAEIPVGLAQAARPPRRSRLVFPHALDLVRSLLTVVVLALFALTFLLQPFRIPSESMERTLLVGDFVLVDKSAFGPAGHWGWLLPYHDVHTGDIIVFHFPLNPSEYVVKRVIGAPGDRVRLRDGLVYRNGRPVREPYAVFESAWPDRYRDQFPAPVFNDPSIDTHWWLEMRRDVADGQLIVPPGAYFVLGDNRNHSSDSRYWGFVPRANILGMPLLVYFSVREPSRTDTARPPADDKLGSSPSGRLHGFARWDRVLRVIR